MERTERTYVMVKPDGVHRGLVGEILKRFETRGYKLVALKMCSPSREHVEKHYEDLKTKKFFPGLVDYMLTGPVVATVWEGTQAVKVGRRIVGETDPVESLPGTIRGDFCIEKGRNIIHASDSVDNAEKEINLWFSQQEIQSWSKVDEKMIFEF
jgi:nucleoside-diphosphate kinase